MIASHQFSIDEISTYVDVDVDVNVNVDVNVEIAGGDGVVGSPISGVVLSVGVQGNGVAVPSMHCN